MLRAVIRRTPPGRNGLHSGVQSQPAPDQPGQPDRKHHQDGKIELVQHGPQRRIGVPLGSRAACRSQARPKHQGQEPDEGIEMELELRFIRATPAGSAMNERTPGSSRPTSTAVPP